MASVLSLALATLVVGTIFNLVDELTTGTKPFRPVESIIVTPEAWIMMYAITALAGGAALLLNLRLDPWLTVLAVFGIAVVIVLVITIEKGTTFQRYTKNLRRASGRLVILVLVATFAAAWTLGFLRLMS